MINIVLTFSHMKMVQDSLLDRFQNFSTSQTNAFALAAAPKQYQKST